MNIVLLLLLLSRTAMSQSNETVDIPNYCHGDEPPQSLTTFISNRNSTIHDLRRQLSSTNVHYATAHASSGGDLVFAAAQCRNYLSVDECLGCFNVSVSNLVTCQRTGAFVFLDECFIRYEDHDFFDNPNSSEDIMDTRVTICGNQYASDDVIPDFNQNLDKFLSEIRYATPKTSNFFVANTRQIIGANKTVYAVAQCAENINPTICRTCLNTAYTNLQQCLPSTEGKFFDMGCFMKYSESPFFNDTQITQDIRNILKGHPRKVATIAGATGAVLALFLILILWLLIRLRDSSKQDEFKGTVNFNYKDLELATNNFSQENLLGKGGYGEVYKATIDDTHIVAVKKLQVQNDRAKEEFENEVKLISSVDHRNLLRLLGWSSEGSHLLLVLEYMANGSLDRFLWGEKRGTLDWNQRYEIILGIARGLAHLHNEFHLKIIHRDIKSSNILLSDDFKPKIADFGLARFQHEDLTHVVTKFAGTLGYTAPEYALRGTLSDKVDTYSFGIVVLEIISGRRSTEVRPSTEHLLEHAWKLYEKKIHINLIDETLDLNQYQQEHVMKIVEIALLCTQSPVSNRPTMSQVIVMLQDVQSLEERKLTRPTFENNRDRRIQIVSSKS